MVSKLRSRRALTLIEMIATVSVLMIIAASLAIAVPSTLTAFREVTASSEAGVLASALTTAVTDELRWATDVVAGADSELDTYTGKSCGAMSRLSSDAGRINVVAANGREYGLLSEKAYTSGLTARAQVLWEDGIFNVAITVRDSRDRERFSTTFSVLPVNIAT